MRVQCPCDAADGDVGGVIVVVVVVVIVVVVVAVVAVVIVVFVVSVIIVVFVVNVVVVVVVYSLRQQKNNKIMGLRLLQRWCPHNLLDYFFKLIVTNHKVEL